MTRQYRKSVACVLEQLEPRLFLTTITVNASGGADYVNLNDAIVAAPSGATILVSPGTYTAKSTTPDPFNQRFWINKPLTIKSTGGAGVTNLVIPSGQSAGIIVTASNVTVSGFTLNGGQFAVWAYDFQTNSTLSNILFQNLTITPQTTGGHGITFTKTTNSVIDSCTVTTAYANGIYLENNSHNNIVMNNTIQNTLTQHGIGVQDSDGAQLIGNTITGAAFDGIIMLNSSYSRVERNNISGFLVDGITLTANPNGPTTHNYIARNTIVSTGRVAGRSDGVGLWLNSGSNHNVVIGNKLSGSAETGLAIFASSYNLIEGNEVFDNGQGGIFVWNAPGLPYTVTATPVYNVITGNLIYNNYANAPVIVRGASNTEVSNNFGQGRSTGNNSTTDAGITVQTSSNTRVFGNTFLQAQIGAYIYADATSTSIFRNRFISIFDNYALAPTTASFDGGTRLGGNYWSGFAAAGDPSTGSTPYTNIIYDNVGHKGGSYSDRYPYQSESLGQSYYVRISDPLTGTIAAVGSERLIRWVAPAAVFVDIAYTSSATGTVTIASNVRNNGLYRWVVPNVAAGTDYAIIITPKSSAQTAMAGGAISNAFSINPGDVTLLTPGRDTQTTAAGSLTVAWKRASASTLVNVELQVDGGTWQTLASNVNGTFATVTLPNVTTNQARIRVRNAANSNTDTQDGYFTIRSTTAVRRTNSPTATVGTNESLTWLSPASSRVVDLEYWTGSAWATIAVQLPDIGRYTWLVPDAIMSNSQIRVTFRDASGNSLGTATSSTFNIINTPSLSFTTSNSSAAFGENLTFTATFKSRTAMPTGTVSFYDGASPLGPLNLDANGIASISFQFLQQGSHTLQAQYAANGSFAAATSGTITQTIGAPSQAGVQVPRYRLYNAALVKHHFTTDANEYNTLGTYGWQQEGTSYSIFNGPTSYNGVTSTPLFRLYFAPTLKHMWTTDANEYNTLRQFPGWTGEGVDGYVLPTAATGATALYRLNYGLGGLNLHLWTVDENEKNTLPSYGWNQEGVAAYVIALVAAPLPAPDPQMSQTTL